MSWRLRLWLMTPFLWVMALGVGMHTWKTLGDHWRQGTEVEFRGPGMSVFSVDAPGRYTLWLVTQGVWKGSLITLPAQLPPGVRIHLEEHPAGVEIPWTAAEGTSMELNGNRRVSLASAELPRAGEYRLEVSGLDEPRLFYLGKSRVFALLRDGLVGFLIVGGLLVAGLLTFVIGFAFPRRPPPPVPRWETME